MNNQPAVHTTDSLIAKNLRKILPAERIRTRYVDLVSYAADAGFYVLLPKAVVRPISEREIVELFRFSHAHSIPLVFRGGGTSLSGQSITDGILVDLSQYWNKVTIETAGSLVRVQPGVTGGMVNAYLKKFSRKIGPDPSSIHSAMMGGILSNNSSGMCCGVHANAYHTTRFIRFILPNGKTYSTEVPADHERFEAECPGIFASLENLRKEILGNTFLYTLIRKKYLTKNTVGYSLNAFVDYERPMDILAHLLIGGEGTLAFIAEAALETIPDHPYKATALLYFPDIYSACKAVMPLRDGGAEAVELMDRSSLRSIEMQAGMPAIVKTLPSEACALLVEFQDSDMAELSGKTDRFLSASQALSMLYPPVFTLDEEEQAFLWKVRKGLFPSVGAVRVSGTTVILEDVAFPLEKMGDAIVDLQRLFRLHGYENAIIFGHAKDGNIHFVVTQSFNTAEEITRYDRFLKAVVELVVNKYDGTLKAEHGTGRNMAPFVQTEWGVDAYRIMQKLKAAIDPLNLLNPGVIINEDEHLHIKNLKQMPGVEEEVDKCIECGYCEHKCPSRDITLTPRRRIVVRRELRKLQAAGDLKNHRLLLKEYEYDGLETCAVDGLCATACPVDINTGDLVKRLRRENHSASQNRIALLIAKNFRSVERLARVGLQFGVTVNQLFGAKTMTRFTSGLRKVFPNFPLWSVYLSRPPVIPRSGKGQPQQQATTPGALPKPLQIVYFPACITRLMGSGAGNKKNLMQTFISVCGKAGIEPIIPGNLAGLCCGQIFSSKGFSDAYRLTAARIMENLWIASQQGSLVVVTDVSSCAYTFSKLRPALDEENRQRFDRMKIMDSVEFLHDTLIPKLPVAQRKGSIVLHPVCSLQKMGAQQKFIRAAKHFAVEVSVPLHAGCCGMAGDRGFLFPELTQAATLDEALEVNAKAYEGYYSSTKTCEIALSEAVKQNYESILYLADESTR